MIKFILILLITTVITHAQDLASGKQKLPSLMIQELVEEGDVYKISCILRVSRSDVLSLKIDQLSLIMVNNKNKYIDVEIIKEKGKPEILTAYKDYPFPFTILVKKVDLINEVKAIKLRANSSKEREFPNQFLGQMSSPLFLIK